jgi:hypothetical protein
MKLVNIKKAHRTIHDQPHESVNILIEEEIEDPPRSTGTLASFEFMMRQQFGGEGRALFEALKGSLPGGTLDRLLVELMVDSASLLIVKYGMTARLDELPLPREPYTCPTCSNYLRIVPVPANFDAVFVCDFCEARRYKEIILRSGLWRKLNFFPGQRGCMLCGYNGEGFYQPSNHRCAEEAARLGEDGGLL